MNTGIGNSSASMTAAWSICNQIASIFAKPTHPHPPPLELLVSALIPIANQNGKVFLYGVGREGLMLKGFCMRLAHLGLSAHSVFDMTAPPISPTDLLIASAGPGGFSTVDAICGVAQSYGARVLVLTAQPGRVKCGGEVCYVPAQTMADDEDDSRPLLLMGSAYEGALFVLFEMVVYELGKAMEQSPEAIRSRHTNLE